MKENTFCNMNYKEFQKQQEQADFNIWLCFGGKESYLKRQAEIMQEIKRE